MTYTLANDCAVFLLVNLLTFYCGARWADRRAYRQGCADTQAQLGRRAARHQVQHAFWIGQN